MRRWFLWAILTLPLTWPGAASAQLAVYDAANFAQNLIQAVQLVFSVANQILELTPVEEIVLSEEYSADLEALGQILTEAQGLSCDLGSLQAQVTSLFRLESAPMSAQGFRERMAEIRRVTSESYSYALRTQTLIQTTLRTVQHLTRLVSAMGSFIGNMQANQTLSQVDSTLGKTLATLHVQTAAYERAQSVDRIAEPLMQESLHRINHELMSEVALH